MTDGRDFLKNLGSFFLSANYVLNVFEYRISRLEKGDNADRNTERVHNVVVGTRRAESFLVLM